MFKFKQFTIHQDKTPMKVGTDGVLIGAWARVESEDKYILDIGAGTGLIALMLAQRTPGCVAVDAIEIDRSSAEQAAENVADSKWLQTINIHEVDICHFEQNFKYDLIVSNPPFFCDSLLSPDKGRTTARHTVSLSFADLVDAVCRLLSPDGRFSLILPTNESAEFERAAAGKLYLWRRCRVNSRVGDDSKRVMSEYRLTESSEVCSEELSIRYSGSNEYTQEYRDLTADFYLKF